MITLNSVVFPEPLGPIRGGHGAFGDLKRAVVDGGHAPEALDHPLDLEQGAHAATCSARAGKPGAVDVGPARGPRGGAADAILDQRQDARGQQQHDDQEDARVADQVELAAAELVGEVLLGGDEDEGAERRAPERARPPRKAISTAPMVTSGSTANCG